MSARAATYLDANAGIPPLHPLREKIGEVLPVLYNPSSGHQLGRAANALVRRAREQVTASLARMIPGISEQDWIITSGGTEALQGAIRAACFALPQSLPKSQGPIHWLYSPTEHNGSLAHRSRWEAEHPGSLVELPLDAQGRVDIDTLEVRLSELSALGAIGEGRPFLSSFLWVNNETGVIQHRLDELCALLRRHGGLILVDAAQAWDKLSHASQANLPFSECDFFVTSGHKLGALSGTGVLAFSKRGRELLTAIPVFSGNQQRALRAGTENALGAWSLGLAAELAVWRAEDALRSLRDELESEILRAIPGSIINGAAAERVCNTLSVSFADVDPRGIALTDRLDLEGFAVSAGSACSAGVRRPSHVLKAMGLADELALASLRISLTPGTSGTSSRISSCLRFDAPSKLHARAGEHEPASPHRFYRRHSKLGTGRPSSGTGLRHARSVPGLLGLRWSSLALCPGISGIPGCRPSCSRSGSRTRD